MSQDVNDPCLACALVAGRGPAHARVLLRENGLVVHGHFDPTPVRGWVVVTSAEHVRGFWELAAGPAAALGPLLLRLANAQRQVLGAEHVYLLALGDVLRHCHLHLVPRYADTPEHLRGRGAFTPRPEDLLAPQVQAKALARLATELQDGP